MTGARRFMTRGAGATALASMLLFFATAGVARAHDVAAPLDVWGNFGPETTACQRAISRAASLCVRNVTAIRSACMQTQLAGHGCDTAATDQAVQAARSQATDIVQSACSQPQLQTLRYIDLHDALTDVVNICRQLDTAATSAVFAPAMVGGSVAAVDNSTQACLNSAASAAAKLLRFAMRARQRTLDHIAGTNLQPADKTALVAHAAQRIARAQAIARRQIDAVCPGDDFTSLYNRDATAFLQGIAQRADCFAGLVYVQKGVTCPTPVCGNGMQEPGEECDDGNDFEGDGCHTDCTKANCDAFPTTFDLIQQAIFTNHGCADDTCHGSARSGDLDLRPGAAYDSLIDVPATTVPGFKRIDPGNKDKSLLWINVAARTFPDRYHAPLRGMPISGNALSADEIEALRIWIETGGASRTVSLQQTAPLLLPNACLPEPKPADIKPLEPPPTGEGVQMHMAVWTLPPKSESEVCFASYYDFTKDVPPELLSSDGKRFRYKTVDIRQDPLSHHLIVDLYRGPEAANDPIWGPYFCKEGSKAGQSCDPLDLGFCGAGSECSTNPDPTAIACIGFGPQTGLSTLTGGGFAFAQETAAEFKFPTGVYSEVPLKGTVLWNSHAFNRTNRTGKMEAWVNIYFPKPDELQHAEIQIFNAKKIFWTEDLQQIVVSPPELPAFEKMEVCHIHLFGDHSELTDRFYGSPLTPTKTAHLFELSGHMHEHGKRFQIFRGSWTCKGGSRRGEACSPFNPDLCPQGTCTEDSGRDPQQSLLYTNFIYNDPVVLRFDEPLLISGSAPRADRSLTFCGLYDNGAPPNQSNVKRRSTSPPPGTVFGFPIGGPCAVSKTRCLGGPYENRLCNGTNAVCDSSSGAGDGVCDACPLTGGFRTKDEMFILFGNYWTE